MTKLLGISGSLRRESDNTKLVHVAAAMFGADEFQMADLNLPLFNEDVEAEGQPESVARICEQMAWADAIIISTPEYNKGISGVLKNMLDWASRPRPAIMEDKPVAVVSAAAGVSGGDRAKAALYLLLIPFKVRLVLYPQVSVGSSYEAFDENGALLPGSSADALEELMSALKSEI